MAKYTKVGVHGALESEDVFPGRLMLPRDDILPFDGLEKIAFGAVGNIDAVRFDIGAYKLDSP